MYRGVVLLFAFVAVQGFSKDSMEKCGKFLAPGGLSCCKKTYIIYPDSPEKSECTKLPKKPPACDAQICLGKRAGFGFDDGTFDKAVLAELLAKKFSDDKDFFGAVKENCFVNDYKEYGPPEFCDLIKMKACIDVTAMKDCPEWDSEGACNGAEKASKECVALFP